MAYEGYTALRVAVADGVATLTIDHPPLNLLDMTLIGELTRVGAALEADDAVRVIVLRSANPDFFIAHADVTLIQLLPTTPPPKPTALGPFHAMVERFRTMPKATIGVVEGIARGGGSELLLSLDMRFAALGRAVLAQPEVALGIIPGGSGTQKLSRLVGLARAIEFVLRSRIVRPEEALSLGLVHELADDALARAREIGAEMARLPPLAIAMAKRSVYDGFDTHLQAGLRIEDSAFLETMMSDDGLKAMQAYLALPYEERRAWLEESVPPRYVGR